MIIKTQFTPAAMWPLARFELGLGLAASVVTWLLVDLAHVHQIILPVTLVIVLGTALSIVIASDLKSRLTTVAYAASIGLAFVTPGSPTRCSPPLPSRGSFPTGA